MTKNENNHPQHNKAQVGSTFIRNLIRILVNDINDIKDIYKKYNNIVLFILGTFIAFGISYYFYVQIEERKKEEQTEERKKEELENRLAIWIETLERREWQLAKTQFTEVLVSQRDHPQTLMYHGLAYYRLDTGDVKLALEDYNQVIEREPKLTEAYVNRGTLYLEQSNYDQAIQDYDQAINLEPKLTQIFISRGVAYYYKGLDDQAIQDYDKAIELNPDFAEAYYNRGAAYADKGLDDRAIQDYDKAIEG